MVDKQSDIEVPAFTHWLSGVVENYTNLWRRLGNLETSFYRDELESQTIERPIFICGLARSGTTILLELLATHPTVATHQYRDFPLLFTPLWWNRFLDRVPQTSEPTIERAHKDGITVTPRSPEAMEEVLWMHFFPDLHNSAVKNVLDGETQHLQFETFYTDHIRKILWLRQGNRYVSKGNYNLTRIEYLLKLFPDARFVIPVREPKTHIASLAKQHRLFVREESRDRRILDYMRRLGHFEFGLDRRPVHLGDGQRSQSILDLWQAGEEVRGLARYWTDLYAWTMDTLAGNIQLKEASLMVSYEELCRHSSDCFSRICEHCGLEFEPVQLRDLVSRLKFPTYYTAEFTNAEMTVLDEETQSVCQSLNSFLN